MVTYRAEYISTVYIYSIGLSSPTYLPVKIGKVVETLISLDKKGTKVFAKCDIKYYYTSIKFFFEIHPSSIFQWGLVY